MIHEKNNLYYSKSNEWKRGKLLEEAHFDNSGNYKKRIVNNYAIIDNYLTKDIMVMDYPGLLPWIC